MSNIIGVVLGVLLAVGFAGHRGQHWAVRVLCLVLFVVGVVAALVFAIFGGRGSVAWDVGFSAVLSFGVVAFLLGLSWLADLFGGRGGVGFLSAGKYAVWFFAALGYVALLMPSKKTEKPAESPSAAIVAPAHAAPLVSNAGPGAAVDAGPGAAPVAPVAPVVTEQGGGAVVEVCDCSTGAVCTGPRGGKFCVDASGNKRYR